MKELKVYNPFNTKDYYILDLNLKSETKRRINNEVKRSMGNIL